MYLLLFLASVTQATAGATPVANAAPVVQKAGAGKLSTEVMDYLTGTWSGSGTFAKSGKPVQSTFQFAPVAGGEALSVRYSERPPQDFAYAGVLSIDARTGIPVMMIASNHEGGARLLRSDGWKDGKIVFTADAQLYARYGRERISFDKLDATHFKATYEMSRDGTTWLVGDTQEYAKENAGAAG